MSLIPLPEKFAYLAIKLDLYLYIVATVITISARIAVFL